MDCPQCKGYQLQPTEIDSGLIAGACLKCSGVLITLINYGYWLENFSDSKSEGSKVDAEAIAADDCEEVKICPKCSRFMLKFRIGLESENRLDFCASCEEVWLDKGEWRLLSQLGLSSQLPKIFTDAWQRSIRKQRQQEFHEQRYIDLLGDADFAKISEFRQWLNSHPEKEKIKQYIMSSPGIMSN